MCRGGGGGVRSRVGTCRRTSQSRASSNDGTERTLPRECFPCPWAHGELLHSFQLCKAFSDHRESQRGAVDHC